MSHIRNLLDGLLDIGAPAQRRTYPALKGFSDDVASLAGDARVVARNLAVYAEQAAREVEIVQADTRKGAKRRGTQLAGHTS